MKEDIKNIQNNEIKNQIEKNQNSENKNDIEKKEENEISKIEKEKENNKNRIQKKASLKKNKTEDDDLDFDFDVDDEEYEKQKKAIKELYSKRENITEDNKDNKDKDNEVKKENNENEKKSKKEEDQIPIEKKINENIDININKKTENKNINVNDLNNLNNKKNITNIDNTNKNTISDNQNKNVSKVVTNDINKTPICDNNKSSGNNITNKKPEANEKQVKQVSKKIIKTEPRLSLPFFANQKEKEIYIDSAIKKLLSESTLLENELKQLMELLYQNNAETKKRFSYTFLTRLKKKINNKVYFLPEYNNFNTLSRIFLLLSIKEEKTLVFNLIIELSSLLKYNDSYLYQKIQNKNKNFKEHDFWKKIIEQSFIDSLNEQATILIKKENKKKKKLQNNTPKEEKSFWKRFTSEAFISTISDFTNNLIIKEEYTQKDNDKNETNLLVLQGYSKYINNYGQLSKEIKEELEKIGKKELEKILYNNIIRMSNYNVDSQTILVLILKFCAEFSFNNETKEYYCNLIDIVKHKNYLNKKGKISLNVNNKINYDNEALICILSNTFLFLPINERIKIFMLRKELNSSGLKKNTFNIILRKKNLSLQNRILIWENILNIKKLQKEYKYQELKKNTFERIAKGELKKGTRLFKNNETIDKDVNRTIFLSNNKENQEKLKNLLRCLNLLIQSIGYYQGMSYIAAFLLQVLNNDEEKTFYFMLSLETQTQYKELFVDNLKLLHTNFGILEKLFEFGLHEVYQHLLDNRIKADYYSPSWFLTVFWCFSSIFEIEKLPQFSILVFEKFILEGWSAVFNGGFTAIQYYYRELLNVNEDLIMNYLITNFCDKEIFKNKDFDTIEKNFCKNSGFINEDMVDILKKICSYEEKYKNEEQGF